MPKANSTSGDGTNGTGAAEQNQNGSANDATANANSQNDQQNDGGQQGGGAGGDDATELATQLAAERKRSKALETQVQNLSKTIDEGKRAAAKGQGGEQWAQQLEQENNTLKEQLQNQRQSTIDSMKMEKLRGEARAQGLRGDAMKAFESLVELENIDHLVDGETGRIGIGKVDAYIRNFKTQNSFLFGNAQQMNVNSGGGRASGGGASGSGAVEKVTFADAEKYRGKPEYQSMLNKAMLYNKAKREGRAS